MHDIIDSKSLAILHASLNWESAFAKHVEKFYIPLNVWRELDLFPPPVSQSLIGLKRGAVLKTSFVPGSLVPAYNDSQTAWFPLTSFARGQRPPRVGRFYPLGLLTGFAQNPQPFRCTDVSGGRLSADGNHPLANRPLDLEIAVAEVRPKRSDTGGMCQDWLQLLLDGPGMQVRHASAPTEFFADNPFDRLDAREDARFYDQPRLVSHIDGQADAAIRALYGSLLTPGSRVLDLMSSWQSHLPDALDLAQVTGLGLNREELAENPRLTGYVVHDLNQNPVLPFADREFDAVICTVSVEYLTQPQAIFREAARVLNPGGLFIHTFSNRWFPPKVVRIWTEVLEWERPGLVLEYFLQCGAFEGLHTFSARGWPRPVMDRYYPQVPVSDPVYAVWGRRRA
jgi:SAM-dependent methyltransferase